MPLRGLHTPSAQKQSRYSIRNYVLCEELHEILRTYNVRHVAAEIIKSLLSIKQHELIAARNRVDIPLGLFGFSLDDFYERRKENIVYLEVLKLICRQTLEMAKACIIIDDVQTYVRMLFDGFEKNDMSEILRLISDSMKMLTIHEHILANYKDNEELSKRFMHKLGAYHERKRHAMLYIQDQLYNIQNEFAEGQLILDPIEYRYKLNYFNVSLEQTHEELELGERTLQQKLKKVMWERSKEVTASDYIQTKQIRDILIYKNLLSDMTAKYNKDYDTLDSQITYKANGMLAMKEHKKDCEEKMRFFSIDKYRLIEWLKDFKQKKKLADKLARKAEVAEAKKAKKKK